MKEKVGRFITRITTSIDNYLRKMDSKVVVGIALLFLGVFILSYPENGTVARIVYYGGSSIGYGITSVFFGLFLLKNPRTRAYPFLITPLILYIVGFIELIWSVYGVPTPLVIYFLCGLLLLKEIVRR